VPAIEPTIRAALPYRILSHTADTGIEATAPTFAELVGELARAMFALMATVDPCPADHHLTMTVPAAPREELVVDALSELLYQAEVEDLILCDIKVEEAEDGSLRIEAAGVGTKEVELAGPPVKAVTYHALTAEPRDDGWFGRVILDV